MLSLIKFHCVDCNVDKRTIISPDVIQKEDAFIREQQARGNQVSDKSIPETTKYGDYLKFVAVHKEHNGYNIGINIKSKEEYEKVAAVVTTD